MVVSWCAKRRPARPDCAELRPPSCVDAARGTMAKRKKHRRTTSSPPTTTTSNADSVALVMADNRPPDLTKWLKEHGSSSELMLDSQAQLGTMLISHSHDLLCAHYAYSAIAFGRWINFL